jgi:hypothetical protein
VYLAAQGTAFAIPSFARTYNVSCNTCHAAFPRLNAFGEQFGGDLNFRLPNWVQSTVQTGDDRLRLPAQMPLSMRAQFFFQARDGENIDPISGAIDADSGNDFQSPYLVKLLSSAPLSDHISYYFYAIFAEKGQNGETKVEDAWVSHDDLFGSGFDMQLGQFQISDLMFPREVRLPFQDFVLYRAADVTYQRGIISGKNLGESVRLDVGFVNGNGVDAAFDLNTPGFQRPDNLFDNDSSKTGFARVGIGLGTTTLGVFGLSGKQRNAEGPAGTATGSRKTDKRIFGLDVSGSVGGNRYWYAQALWNKWEGFLDPAVDYRWWGLFGGIDYIRNDRWAYSLLYNYMDADDFENTNTIFEGIEMNTVTLAATYYFMRNVKGVIELNIDLLDEKPQTGPFFTGHLEQENYFLVGIDLAF